ncbi:MAG TPA: hypothetical protein VGW36_06495, partial [Pyrinomonadaceae bacterium]|nr:hypothetical protein [Pyrinomonadaceae bacterium]
MNKRIFQFKTIRILSLVVVLFVFSPVVFAQHEGHVMPGVSKPKPKPRARAKRKTVRRKKRVSAKKRPAKSQPAPKHNMTTMPGMHNPKAGTPHANMPHAQPASSPKSVVAPVQSTSPHQTHTPGMHTPATPAQSPTPGAAPHTATHGETKPQQSPSPSAGHENMPMHAPQPAASPTSATQPHVHQPAGPAGANTPTSGQPGHEMDMGPLVVMTGDTMSVRVGSSDTNVMPMGQMGSGTSWTPASTPMHMIHKRSGDWLLMFHYNAVVGVNSQGGPRGVTKAESANWFMPMAFRKLGKGTLQLRGMFSFEPFTFPPGGSPLLFQTGETYKGRPIIDAQHPHDLFMELSAQYTHPLGERGTWFTYFGYPGEPALGPTAFMHRASASENPAAPLSHHLMDSSHITFGVLTSGFTYRWLKLEASVFNGREPDENRYNFEAHRWNSRSARLSIAPNKNWSLQISHGLLRDPEALEPGDVRRTTASISYNRPFTRGSWASSLIWGRNHENHGGEIFNLNGYVAESTVNFIDKNYLYTRLELVDKNSLLRDADRTLL